MPDDKKTIEPIDAEFDDVAKAMTASAGPAVDIEKFLAKAKKAREAANEISAQIDLELVRFDGENVTPHPPVAIRGK